MGSSVSRQAVDSTKGQEMLDKKRMAPFLSKWPKCTTLIKTRRDRSTLTSTCASLSLLRKLMKICIYLPCQASSLLLLLLLLFVLIICEQLFLYVSDVISVLVIYGKHLGSNAVFSYIKTYKYGLTWLPFLCKSLITLGNAKVIVIKKLFSMK